MVYFTGGKADVQQHHGRNLLVRAIGAAVCFGDNTLADDILHIIVQRRHTQLCVLVQGSFRDQGLYGCSVQAALLGNVFDLFLGLFPDFLLDLFFSLFFGLFFYFFFDFIFFYQVCVFADLAVVLKVTGFFCGLLFFQGGFLFLVRLLRLDSGLLLSFGSEARSLGFICLGQKQVSQAVVAEKQGGMAIPDVEDRLRFTQFPVPVGQVQGELHGVQLLQRLAFPGAAGQRELDEPVENKHLAIRIAH